MIFILAPHPTLPTDIGAIDEVTIVSVTNNFLQNVRDEIQRYGIYLRQKFMEIINRMKQFGTKISDRFNFSG